MSPYAAPSRLTQGEVEWRAGDGGRFTEPFFEETLARWRRAGGAAWTTPPSALEADEADPAALIFHVSRCGSTLATRMLGAPAHHLAVSEAPVVDDILRRTPDAPETRKIAWLRGAMAAFARSQTRPPERLFVKLDAWHLFELPLLRRAFPAAPTLFIYRDPLEVLVSLSRMPSLMTVRDTVDPARLGLTEDERNRLSRDELAAAVQGALYRTALDHREALIGIGYPELVDALPRLPALGLTPEERAVMRAAATADAKSPDQDFTPDTARKRAEAPTEVREAAERWARVDYREWLRASA
ncbi:hypothetical protein [Caulobacter mirabilis]|uniref:Aspartyl beta-hydroxylase n=1 Tax=Caulobacter mirabilis TaxID=69666 RepID=A0A2D2AUB2_9CAUL|nr:hypothetical protein [Caulobacter mirabilis]ATQ41581.1 hypothetical protein CSW64_03720 [Caulobacter mirabilis]